MTKVSVFSEAVVSKSTLVVTKIVKIFAKLSFDVDTMSVLSTGLDLHNAL